MWKIEWENSKLENYTEWEVKVQFVDCKFERGNQSFRNWNSQI